MAFETLKTLINDNIKSGLPNGIRPEEEHNPVLQSIVTTLGSGYAYMGLATTGTSPLVDDVKRMYITSGYGTYTAFLDSNATAIKVAVNHISVIKGVSGVWSQDIIVDFDAINVEYSADVMAKLDSFKAKHAQYPIVAPDYTTNYVRNASNLVTEITNGLDTIGVYYKEHEAAGTLDSFQEFFTVNMLEGTFYGGGMTSMGNIMDVNSGIPSTAANNTNPFSSVSGYLNDGKNFISGAAGHMNGSWLGGKEYTYSTGFYENPSAPLAPYRNAWGIGTQKMSYQPTDLTFATLPTGNADGRVQAIATDAPKWDNNNITVNRGESDNLLPQTAIVEDDWETSGPTLIIEQGGVMILYIRDGGEAINRTVELESSKEYLIRIKATATTSNIQLGYVKTNSQSPNFTDIPGIPFGVEDGGFKYFAQQFSFELEDEYTYNLALRGEVSDYTFINDIEVVEIYDDKDVYKKTPALMSANNYGLNRTGRLNDVGQDWKGISVEDADPINITVSESTYLTFQSYGSNDKITLFPPASDANADYFVDASTTLIQVQLYITALTHSIKLENQVVITEPGFHRFTVDAGIGNSDSLGKFWCAFEQDSITTFDMSKSSVSYYRESNVPRYDGVTLLQGASSVLPQYTEYDPFQSEKFYQKSMMNMNWDNPEYNWFESSVTSVLAKAGDLSHLVIGGTDFSNVDKDNAVVSSRYQYFNLSDGTVGSSNGVIRSGMQEMADGWYLCWVCFPHESRLGGFVTPRFSQANADLDTALPTFTTNEGADGITLAYPDFLPESLPRQTLIADNPTYVREYKYGSSLYSEDVMTSQVLPSSTYGHSDKSPSFYMYSEIDNPFVHTPEYTSARGILIGMEAIYEDTQVWTMGFYRDWESETLYQNTIFLGLWNGEEMDFDMIITAELPSGWQDLNDGFVKFGGKVTPSECILYANGSEMASITDYATFDPPQVDVFGTSYEQGMSNTGHVRAIGFTSIDSITDEQLMNLTSID